MSAVTPPPRIATSSVAAAPTRVPVVEFKLADWYPLPDPPESIAIAALLPSHSPAIPLALTLQGQQLFSAGSRDLLPAITARAKAIDPSYQPPKLRHFLRVKTATVGEAELLAAALRAAPGVDFAEVQVVAPLPAVQPGDEPLITRQIQHRPPLQGGVNPGALWIAGTDGSGVRMADIEWGFDPHVALPAIADVSWDPAWPHNRGGSHGTAVLGIVGEVDDTSFGLGIAPRTELGIGIRYGIDLEDDRLGDALIRAMDWLRFGDILLIEQHHGMDDEYGNSVNVPIELHPLFTAAILATLKTLGIIVVEPSGNGRRNIDADCANDSGFIMVGGISPQTRLRVESDRLSNFGVRVNCHAFYGGIVTTGHAADFQAENGLPNFPGSGPPRSLTAYTDTFYGTSATSAIVAGAAALLQSYVIATRAYRLDPRQVRALLSALGEPSAQPATDCVGVLPDLGKCRTFADQGGTGWIGSNALDDGTTPRAMWGSSPDILVRSTIQFSGMGILQPATEIKIRAHNSGAAPLFKVPARVYYAPFLTLDDVTTWRLLGSVYFFEIPPDTTRECDAPLVVEALNDFLGYTLIAILDDVASLTPPIHGVRPGEMDRFFANNRNVAALTRLFRLPMRPIDFIVPRIRFQVPIWKNESFDQEIVIEVRHRLPAHTRVTLVVPALLAPKLEPGDDGQVRVPVERHEPGSVAVRVGPARPTEVLLEIEGLDDEAVEEPEFHVTQRIGARIAAQMVGRVEPPARVRAR